MKNCPNFNQVLVGRNKGKREAYVIRNRCKMWSCEYCAEINRRNWMYRIIETVAQRQQTHKDEKWYFWTITLKPSDHTTIQHSLKKWRSVWGKLIGKIKYDLGKLMYVRLFETHKSGILHVHVLCNATYDDVVEIDDEHTKSSTRKRYYSETFKDVTRKYELGDIHDIRPIVTTKKSDNGIARNVASYIAKYMTKDVQGDIRSLLHDSGMGKIRIIQTSHGWVKIEKIETDTKWTIGALDMRAFGILTRDGYEVSDLNQGNVVTFDDYENDEMYPSQQDSTNEESP